jgi:hypothetical protein
MKSSCNPVLAVTRCQTREGAESYKMSGQARAILMFAMAPYEGKALKYQEKSAMSEVREASRTG